MNFAEKNIRGQLISNVPQSKDPSFIMMAADDGISHLPASAPLSTDHWHAGIETSADADDAAAERFRWPQG